MEYTTNYQLPTWVETDRIQMADFNDMTGKLDTALAEQSETLAEHTAAIAGFGNCSIYTTSRQGAGARYTTFSITFPTQPVFVIIMGAQGGVGFFAYGAAKGTGSAGNIISALNSIWSDNTLTVDVGPDASVGLNSNELYYIYAILQADT